MSPRSWQKSAGEPRTEYKFAGAPVSQGSGSNCHWPAFLWTPPFVFQEGRCEPAAADTWCSHQRQCLPAAGGPWARPLAPCPCRVPAKFFVALLVGKLLYFPVVKSCSWHSSQSVESLSFVTEQLHVGVTIARVSIKEAVLPQLTVYYLNILTLTGKLGVLTF